MGTPNPLEVRINIQKTNWSNWIERERENFHVIHPGKEKRRSRAAWSSAGVGKLSIYWKPIPLWPGWNPLIYFALGNYTSLNSWDEVMKITWGISQQSVKQGIPSRPSVPLRGPQGSSWVPWGSSSSLSRDTELQLVHGGPLPWHHWDLFVPREQGCDHDPALGILSQAVGIQTLLRMPAMGFSFSHRCIR